MSENLTAADRLRDISAEVKAAYKRLFAHPDADLVLADLAIFANINGSTLTLDSNGRVDPYATHHEEGKRRVALRIFSFTERTPSEILEAKSALKTPNPTEAEED